MIYLCGGKAADGTVCRTEVTKMSLSEKKHRFKYSSDNKRYHTLNYHFQKMFGFRVEKAVIDAGFTCPNIDGTCGNGGCSFCLNGAGEFTQPKTLSVTQQLQIEANRILKKCGGAKLIAYFQSHTNTYADCDILEKKYNEALSFPNVIGLSVGTRPDCINEANADLIACLSRQAYITVELGLQTIHDETAKKFNRGYTFDEFCRAFYLLKRKNIRVCVHIINGLYCETRENMVETAIVLGKMRPDAVKIHSLHILKGTEAQRQLENGEIVPMTKDRYIDTVCRQLAYLSPECVIERLTGDGSREKLIAPIWSADKISVLAGIDKEMSRRSLIQGEFFENL